MEEERGPWERGWNGRNAREWNGMEGTHENKGVFCTEKVENGDINSIFQSRSNLVFYNNLGPPCYLMQPTFLFLK